MINTRPIMRTCITCLLLFLSVCVCRSADPTHALRHVKVGPGTLEPGASLRLRYEYLDQFNVKKYGTGKSDNVLLSRLRLGLRYRLDRGPGLFVQAQDSRFWLSDDVDKHDYDRSCPYYNEFDLRQAYVEWHTIGGSALGFKMGRQAVSYGDNRLFGPGDWGNVGRYTWDAGKLLWRTKALDVDLIHGKRIQYLWNAFDDTHYDFDVYAAYAQLKSISEHKLDLFYVVKSDGVENTLGESGSGDLLVQTTGFYGNGHWRQVDYGATFAYQFGNFGNDDIRAFGLNAGLGYRLPYRFKPRLSLSLSYGSGDEDPNDGKHGTFDGVFGAIDKYYGRMNLFTWMNLVDWQTGLSLEPMPGVRVCLDYHRFRLAEKRDAWYFCNGKQMRRDETGSSGSNLGGEVDLICKYKVNRHVEIMAGYGHFFPGTFVKKTGTHKDAQWAFTQLLLSF